MTRKWFASAILLISAGGEPRASDAIERATSRGSDCDCRYSTWKDAADARRDRYALFFSKPSLRANFT